MFQNSFFYKFRNLQSGSYKSTIKTSYVPSDNIRVNFCQCPSALKPHIHTVKIFQF